MNDVKPSLQAVLRRLKLGGLTATLPDRAAHAQKTNLAPLDFLELALTDEIGRRVPQESLEPPRPCRLRRASHLRGLRLRRARHLRP